MATNGKDGMTPNVSFSGNNSGQRQEGIFGYLQNRSTQTNFSREYWKEGSGYLDSALKDLKEMQKLYKQLEKSQDKMTTSQENQFKSQKRALELQISTLEDIKQTQEVSDRDAIRSIKDANKIRQKGMLDYQKLLDNVAKRQEQLKSGDKELAKQLREDAEYINNMYASVNKEVSQINLNIETTGETLKNTQTSFAKAMSSTLKTASDELSGLLNMFNLDKLANSGLNKFLTDKIAVQNDMMKQFGFETKNQYLDFKNELDTTLGSMGSLFSGTDLKQYMSNLSSMGVTNTKMAQEQMRASIMGSKYLGVSAETQTEMFKWMKRTNDYDMLDEHNKVITGLLKSQLGISKEQLDALSQVAYGDMESKSALGMSSGAIQAQAEASSVMGAVLSNMYDPETAKAIQGALNDFMLNPGDASWINVFGSQYQSLYNSLFSENTREGQSAAINKWLQGIQNSNVLNTGVGSGGLTTAIGNKYTNALTALGDTTISAMQGFDNSKYLRLQQDALNGILESNDDQFVQETTEITWLEQIYNRIDQWMTAWDSAHLTSLANTALALWAGSKIFDVAADIKQLGLLGNIKTAFSSGGKGLIANGGGILIGAAAVAAIAGAVKSTLNVGNSEESLEQFTEDFSKKSYLGKAGTAMRAGISNTLGTAGSFYGKLFGDEALEAKSRWLEASSNFTSGLYGDKATLYQLAAIMAFDKVGWLKYTGVTDKHSDIAKRYNNLTDEEKEWVKRFASRDSNLSPLIKGIDWSNYHKAGLNYVPKDNYKALLHKGEMVLNADEANAYRKGYGIGGYDAVPWPITSKYSSMSKIRSGYHTGTDFGAPAGTPVGAAIGGEIVQTSWGGAWGNHIIVRGDNGLYYLYAHLSRKAVEGGRVNTGQTIGYVGSTGNSTGPHLHFEVQKTAHWSRGNELDPAAYVTSGLLGDSSAISPSAGEVYGSPLTTTSDGSTSSTVASSGIPIRTGRFSLFSNSTRNSDATGIGGADRIVNSVNGGFGRLMNYLDNIRQEQDIQREMISAFSRTNTESTI